MTHEVVILAGGQGNRMASELPKPLVLVKGKAIINHQIDYFLGKVKKIIISLGHRAPEVKKAIQLQYKNNPALVFAQEEKPLGTAGGIKNAAKQAAAPYVIVLNCDDITDIPLKTLCKIKENTICVAHPILPFGLIQEREGYAIFKEKPKLESWVSLGWYVLNRQDIILKFPNEGSVEYEVFPRLKFRLYKHKGLWHPLNTKKDIIEFEALIPPARARGLNKTR
jgi:NDP-sugar pyrophosphorylase family protein